MIILLSLLTNAKVNAQDNLPDDDEFSYVTVEDSSKKKRIEIINTDLFKFITLTDSTQKDTSEFKSTTIRKFIGNVLFHHKGTDFYCDNAIQYLDSDVMVASGNVHIQKKDSFDVWADYLVYYSNEKLAKFRGNVIFKDSTSQLLTDSLDYDLNKDIGYFWGGGTFITDSSTLTSEEGIYYQRDNEAYFYENVHLKNPEFDLFSDSMRYDAKEKVAHFIAPTKIINGDDIIFANSGEYDTKNNTAKFGGNTQMKSGSTKISAEELFYDKEKGYGEAKGNVIWEDTTEEITIIANYTEYSDSLDYVMATDDPLLIDVTDGDTMYLSADTLITYKLPYPEPKAIENSPLDSAFTSNNDSLTISIEDSVTIIEETIAETPIVEEATIKDSIRIFHAFKDARILNGRMSGVCDSMYFSTGDSVFRLNQNPMVWVDTTQFSGDSMNIVLKHKALDRILIYRNALIIHENVKGVYDQTKGKLVEGFFEDEQLTKMEIKGNGESIYFIKDDSSAFVGGNQTICSKMVIMMKEGENEVDHIMFITKPEATFTPFRMINLGSYQLDGFTWQFEKKPKNVNDIVRNKITYAHYLLYLGKDLELVPIEEESKIIPSSNVEPTQPIIQAKEK